MGAAPAFHRNRRSANAASIVVLPSVAGGCMVVIRRDRCGLRGMLTWQSAKVVTEADCSTNLQKVLCWVSDTGWTHWWEGNRNESALQACPVFTTREIALSCQKPEPVIQRDPYVVNYYRK